MPVSIHKNDGGYRVSTPHGVKAKHTTKEKAERQRNLLNAVDHGWKPTGAPARESTQDQAAAIVDVLLDDKSQRCRIKDCKGKVVPSNTSGMQGLCKSHQERQADRERQSGEHSQSIRSIWKGHEQGHKDWQDTVRRMK